ncbi:signal transduction histidine kinase [Methylobacterium sp. BE186]|uniref:sensor histidine kinase n=1 Tax=Methylobacterium sp. BE186 TaxID=2817715 RepID=UPI00285638CB|nr:sensor histidine kinase [Methylobacterium sp. BE186]MDR7039441.1 signal transduction histidine kinase [Methylobacterium sp. BE186]
MTALLTFFSLRQRSIAVRLAVSALLASSAILLIAAWILTTLYRENTERAFDSRLLVFANNLATDLVSPSDPESRSFSLGDPRFDLPLSGWYWQVGRPEAKPRDLRTSRSLVGVPLKPATNPDGKTGIGQIRQGYGRAQDDRLLRIIERDVDLGEEGRYTVRIAGPADEIVNDVDRFRFSLFVTFGLLGLFLALTTLLQIRFGLAPLAQLRAALGVIRRGEADRITGSYPPDIAPLAGEVNLLIETNREILERARTQVGNLAHALKTPLSIIVNEVGSAEAPEELAAKIREQASLMRDQVNYYLDRARAAALAGTLGTSTEVEPALAGLVRTFGKIYRDKDIAYEVSVSAGLRFRGERQDFEEMVGNLVDNASKWAHGRVAIRAEAIGKDDYPHLLVAIEDDGPGLPPEDREAVIGRGRRLDETKPGSGLGLSIVADLAALYRGRFRLEEASLGGLRAVLEVPGDAPAAAAHH